VAGIIFYGTNPVYNHDTAGWTEGIKKAKLSVSFASTKDETAGLCNYVCPDNHFLESWGDAEPRSGEFQFIQPTITNVFNTRQAQVSLLSWAGVSLAVENDHLKNKGILTQKLAGAPYYHYMRKLWTEKLGEKDFDKSFNSCLHDGVYAVKPAEAKTPAYSGNVTELASAGRWKIRY
jgi:molybdopterin-containing oxidoreductase family iron-sulfur binding subunit